MILIGSAIINKIWVGFVFLKILVNFFRLIMKMMVLMNNGHFRNSNGVYFKKLKIIYVPIILNYKN